MPIIGINTGSYISLREAVMLRDKTDEWDFHRAEGRKQMNHKQAEITGPGLSVVLNEANNAASAIEDRILGICRKLGTSNDRPPTAVPADPIQSSIRQSATGLLAIHNRIHQLLNELEDAL